MGAQDRTNLVDGVLADQDHGAEAVVERHQVRRLAVGVAVRCQLAGVLRVPEGVGELLVSWVSPATTGSPARPGSVIVSTA